MLAYSLSQAVVISTLFLASLVDAANPSASTRTTESTSIRTRRPNEKPSGHPDDRVIGRCSGHIKECGTYDKAKIIYIPKSTVTHTNKIVSTSVVTLPAQTNTITSIEVKTTHKKTKGHCRETVWLDGDPVTVEVDIKVIDIEEIIPITNTTIYSTTTVTATALEQCFLEDSDTLQHGPGHSSRKPAQYSVSTTTNDISPSVNTDVVTDTDEPGEHSHSDYVSEGMSHENPVFPQDRSDL